MKGLIIRGIYSLTRPKNLLIMLCFIGFELLMVVLAALSPDMNGDTFSYWMVAFITALCLTIVINSMIFEDESSRFTAFCINTPVGRKGYVSGQYAVMSIMNAAVMLISALCPLILYIRTNTFEIKEFILGLISLYFISELLIAFILPVSLRFGEKNVIVVFAVLFVFMMFGGVFVSMNDIVEKLGEMLARNDKLIIALTELPLTAAIVLLSRAIAVKLFFKREF